MGTHIYESLVSAVEGLHVSWDTDYWGYSLAQWQFCAGVLIGEVKVGRGGGGKSCPEAVTA